MKHGLSKQVASSSGFSLLVHASSSKVWNFPPLMLTHKTILLFTPRPQVVLHCRTKQQKHIELFNRNVADYFAHETFCSVLVRELQVWIFRVVVSPAPSLGSASVERSPSPRRAARPAACSPGSTGSQEPPGRQESCSTRDEPSSHGRRNQSTATNTGQRSH